VNINGFFLIILAGLIVIYVAFKPLDIKQQEFGEIPLFELSSFTIHELSPDGLVTVMKGSEAVRFKNRYKVEDINYTDNSEKYRANMKANLGIYKDKSEVLNLKGNIVYVREDGLTFKTRKLTYNQKTSIAKTNTKYIMDRNGNEVRGSSLVYNNALERMKSKNITVKYQLKEEK